MLLHRNEASFILQGEAAQENVNADEGKDTRPRLSRR